MPFESKPISVEKVEGFIKEKQKSASIEFDNFEKEIIKEVLNKLPESINTGSLTKFCKNKVDLIMSKYPDKKEKADIIRNHVQKEMLFDLYNEYFLEIKESIENEKPEEVNPRWIRTRFPAIELLIRRNMRTVDDKVDWDFVAEKLNIKKIFKYQEKIIRSKEEAITDLKQLLEKEKPEAFSPIWIERADEKLHFFLRNNFLDKDNNTDWSAIVETLGKEWKDKWSYRESQRNRHLNDVADIIINFVKEKNPENFGPHWIIKNCNKEYTYFQNHVRDIDGGIYWGILVDLLPIDLREKWNATSKDRSWNFESATEKLKSLLEEENPTTFNSRWIQTKDQGLYLYFLREIINEKGIDWDKIIRSLPEDYQKRWKKNKKIKENKESDFSRAMKYLKKIIKDKNPEAITSGFIGREDPNLLLYFRNNLKGGNDEINWGVVSENLGYDLRKKCHFPKRIENYTPKNEYFNESEVNEIINSFRNKLYSIFETINKDDYEYRNKIYLAFIKLAQKGNVLAKEKLSDYLEILVTQWVENDEKLKTFIGHSDRLRERIEKCIYFYNTEESEATFLTYLHTSLSLEAKGIPRPKYIILNEQYKNSKETIESRMKFEDEEY